MTKWFPAICMALAVFGLCTCANEDISMSPAAVSSPSAASAQQTRPANQTTEDSSAVASSEAQTPQGTASDPEQTLIITVGEYEFQATFEQNSSAEEFRSLLLKDPLTIEMEDYGGFEKVGPLGTTLTRNDEQITTEPGDVILYQGNQITIYYGTNSWQFTRLAKIDNATDLQAKLGNGTVLVTFSLE